MATIETDLAGLKRISKEFLDALPGSTVEEADAGWKCFSLAFLGCHFRSKAEEVQGEMLFNILGRKMHELEEAHEREIWASIH